MIRRVELELLNLLSKTCIESQHAFNECHNMFPPLQYQNLPQFANRTKSTDIATYILLINRSLLTGLPFFPPANLGVSVHISFTFSRTILQCLSKALTRASSLRLLRHEIKTCVCERTAVCRIDRGPDVNSCCSRAAISNSLELC